jgi:hypothetical protein
MSLFRRPAGEPANRYDRRDITAADPAERELDRQAGRDALEAALKAEADGDLERAQELRRILGD